MDDIESALTASRNAADQLIANAVSSGRAWDAPCAPGKWSPSQIVEHVARSYEASVNVAAGQPSAFPTYSERAPPAVAHRVSANPQARRVPERQDDKGDESGGGRGHAGGRTHAPDGGARALRGGVSCRRRAQDANEDSDVRRRCRRRLRSIHGTPHPPSHPSDRVSVTVQFTLERDEDD